MFRFMIASTLLTFFYTLTSCHQNATNASTKSVAVTKYFGKVSILRAGQNNWVGQSGVPVLEGDVIVTSADSTVDLDIAGRGVVRVGPESRVSFNGLVDMKKGEVHVESGSLLAAMNKLKATETLNVFTPVAIAGVRGTSFQVSVVSGKSKLSVLTGLIEFKNQKGDIRQVAATKQSAASSDKIATVRDIAGSSLSEVKELLVIEGVSALAEYPAMVENLKALEVLDKKAGGDIDADKELWGSFVGRDAKEANAAKLNDESAAAQKKRKSSFSSEKDMMVK